MFENLLIYISVLLGAVVLVFIPSNNYKLLKVTA
jgi:hypothetical protein